MRIGCAAYSYRDLLNAHSMTLEQFVDTCAGLGLDGVELTAYYFPSTDRDYLNHLKRHCFRRGQHILGTAIGGSFAATGEDKRREQVAITKSWIDHSVILGAPCIRVFAGAAPPGIDEDRAFGWAVECLQECTQHGAEAGVSIALENHSGLTATASQVRRFLDSIDSPWFGLNLDFGNFEGDIYRDFEELAPHAITTHAKVTTTGASGNEALTLDYDRICRIMKSAGYDGYMSIEFEEDEDPVLGVPRFVEVIRSALS